VHLVGFTIGMSITLSEVYGRGREKNTSRQNAGLQAHYLMLMI
jgi:hypothetical protein